MQSQRGSGALVMVMIILLMGSLLLHATRRQLSDNLSLVGDEQRYIRQFSTAMSGLAWGERLSWSAVERWQCRQQEPFPWRACLLRVDKGNLLRADSGGDDTLALYRWVSSLTGGRLRALPHGWLDYCPLAEGEACATE